MIGPSVVGSERSDGGVLAGGRLIDTCIRRINARMIRPTTSSIIQRILMFPRSLNSRESDSVSNGMIRAEHLQVNQKALQVEVLSDDGSVFLHSVPSGISGSIASSPLG